MDFTTLTQLFIPVVLLACLVVGYIIKHWIADVDNKYIPTILAVFGAILAVLAAYLDENPISIETVVYGAFTGLASTGLYEAFKNYIDKLD